MKLEDNFENVYRIVFEALEKGNKIDRMLEEVSEKLNISIVLINSYGQIIAHTGYRSEKCNTVSNQEAFSGIVNQYISRNMGTQKGNLIKRTEQGMQIINAIFVKDNLEGYCITYHLKESDEKVNCQLNQLICRVIAVRLRENGNIKYMDEPAAKQIISGILLGNPNSAEKGLVLHERYYKTYVIDPFILAIVKAEKDSFVYGQIIRQKICEQFQNVLIYIESQEIRLLFVDIKTEKIKELIYERLTEILDELNLLSAVSAEFEDVEEIQTKRKILDRIMKIGKYVQKKNCLFKEEEYYLELICSYAYESIGNKGYAYKKLNLLKKEDKEKGTEFYHTLKEYLACGNNVNLAAKKLFIHRNTMVYRLSKIQEMIHMDVNDPEVSKKLLISMILGTFCSETK